MCIRDRYKDGLAKSREGLLDVLQRAGISVMWTDNNSGCKGACDRVPNHKAASHADPQLCTSEECKDGVLLSEMQDLSLIHISEPTRLSLVSRMPSSA